MSAPVAAEQITAADPAEAFALRAWARARLVAEGELELTEAADRLQADAERSGLVAELGQDAVQQIMARPFGRDTN